MARRLRSGYTTGACAAAAAKAAAMLLVTGQAPGRVEIPFPDDSRVEFAVHTCGLRAAEEGGPAAHASIIKDAGDDPDVTNGAEISAVVRLAETIPAGAVQEQDIWLQAGPGVGRVSKLGLAVAVGEPAINPVPRRMIRAAVREALQPAETRPGTALRSLVVEIGVANGEQLAAKTLNYRLGIVGGLSILGTTGIVRPVSAEAWQATIVASLDVAKAAGLREVVLSTGRTSEKAVLTGLGLPEEAGVMMGDYLAFSLLEAGKRGFARLHLAAMWAKIIKAALAVPQTHVRHGALEMADARQLLVELAGVRGAEIAALLAGVNTGREILERLHAAGEGELVAAICRQARAFAEKSSGLPVRVHLVGGNGKVIFDE